MVSGKFSQLLKAHRCTGRGSKCIMGKHEGLFVEDSMWRPVCIKGLTNDEGSP